MPLIFSSYEKKGFREELINIFKRLNVNNIDVKDILKKQSQ